MPPGYTTLHSTASRDDATATVTVDPPDRHLAICGSATLDVPVNEVRTLDVTASVDRDTITFACTP